MPTDTAALKSALFQRFDRYARIHTTSDAASATVPSTACQLDLSRLLRQELLDLGVADAEVTEQGYVYAHIPATPGHEAAPAVGFIAHVDTSPAVSGKGVVPQIHRAWDGGDITISAERGLVLSPTVCKYLAPHVGHDIITASGGTLLGADNKAGVAIIMTLAAELLAHPELPHGPVSLAFSVDEEIGRGMNHFDVARFGAPYAYTLDGDIAPHIEYECFNADGVAIDIVGRSIHPAIAKDALVNAITIAAGIVAAWPEARTPEHTECREGFIMFAEMSGDVERAKVSGIVRDHDLDRLRNHEALLEAIVAAARVQHPGATINLTFTQQYRNMRQIIDQHPQVVELLQAAMRDTGLEPVVQAIRGGTDGSRLSFMGVPTPNVFTGGYNYHARDEWVSLDSMAASLRVVVALLARWAKATATATAK